MASNAIPYYRRPHLRFFLGDLKVDEEKKEFYVGTQQVVRADLIGAVVTFVRKGNLKLFDFDDGTGRISCVQFLQDELNYETTWQSFMDYRAEYTRHNQAGSVMSKRPSKATCILLDSFATDTFKPQTLEFGDFVNIRGRLQIYNAKSQIIVNHWRRIKDFDEYSFRIFQVEEQNNSRGVNVKVSGRTANEVAPLYVKDFEISGVNSASGATSSNSASVEKQESVCSTI